MVVSRVTKIEQEKERNGNRGGRRDGKGHGTKERGMEERYPRRSVAEGEDGPSFEEQFSYDEWTE